MKCIENSESQVQLEISLFRRRKKSVFQNVCSRWFKLWWLVYPIWRNTSPKFGKENKTGDKRFGSICLGSNERKGFSGGSAVKNPSPNEGDMGLIPGSGRSPGEGNGNPFQCSCLGNPMDRGALRATVHRVAKVSDMT